MTKPTKRAALTAILWQLGGRETATKSERYLTIVMPDGKHYHLGAAGALRTGRIVSGSISLTDTAQWHRLIATGRDLLARQARR